MNKSTIQSFLRESGISPGIFSLWKDDEYGFFTEAFVRGDFTRELRAHQFAEGIRYEENASDCNFFSDDAILLAKNLWRKNPERSRHHALCVFSFAYYRRGSDVGHNIVLFVVPDPTTNEPKLLFYDPQGCKVVHLTQEEIESCVACSP